MYIILCETIPVALKSILTACAGIITLAIRFLHILILRHLVDALATDMVEIFCVFSNS